MKKIFAILAFVGVCFVILAQEPAEEIINRFNYVFAEVNRSNVSTGLLSNYGVQPMELEYYNGVPADSNFVDISIYKLLYAGIYSAKFNNNISLITPDELSDRVQNYSSASGVIPVSVMHYQYNRFIETAVEDGLVEVVNDQIIEVEGKSPYETADLFAVSPREVFVEGGTVSFTFPSTLHMANVTQAVQSIQVCFDEGLPYRNTGWNTQLSHTYTSEGVKRLLFKINYADGRSFISQTNILVKIPSETGGGTRSTGPEDAAGVAGARYDFKIPATSSHSGGVVQVQLASSNTSGKIKKAFIVAEGFDLSPKFNQPNMDLDYFLRNSDMGSINDQTVYPNIYNAIKSDYDIVYVDNNNGTDDIRRNAALFMEALDKINSSKYKEGDYPNVVMGISMGGLVARYALRKMELAGKDHKTWKYISMDSPHRGANIPVGIQAAARDLGSQRLSLSFIPILKTTWFFKDLKEAMEVLDSKAAKQMLIYYTNQIYFDHVSMLPSLAYYDNSVHNEFMQEYHDLGLPTKCQNVAISNGKLNGETLFPAGSKMLDFKETFSLKWWQETLNAILGSGLSSIFAFTNHPELLLNIFPGKSQISVSIGTNAIGTTPKSNVYHAKIQLRKKILWLINATTTITESTLKTETGMLPIDGASGGIYDIDVMLGDFIKPFEQYLIHKKFCFVPTVSALDLSDWKSKLSSNLQGQDLFSQGSTNFEYTSGVINASSEQHTTFNSSNQFIINQLKDKPVYPNTPIQSTFCGSQNVTLSNPLDINLRWSVSDNMFSVDSPTNTSAVIKSAYVSKNAFLTIASTNKFPLRRKLMSSCNLNLSISGPSTICDQATYTINSLPEGAVVQWSHSEGLLLFGENNNSKATFNSFPDLITNIYGWIQAEIHFENGLSSLIIRKENITINIPRISNLFVPSTAKTGEILTFKCDVYGEPCDVNFSITPNFGFDINKFNQNSVHVGFGRPGDYLVRASVSSLCGTDYEERLIRVTSLKPCDDCPNPDLPRSLALYPNPSSDMVNIQLKELVDEYFESQDLYNKGVSEDSPFAIAEIQLWSSTSLLRTYKTDQEIFQLSVSDLPKGIYFVRVIKDGKTYTEKLIKN